MGVVAGMCINAFMQNTLQENKQTKKGESKCLSQADSERHFPISSWMQSYRDDDEYSHMHIKVWRSMSLISGVQEVILYFASKLCSNCGWIHPHFGKSSEPTLYNCYQSSKEITANVILKVNLRGKGFNFPASCVSTGLHINAVLGCHSNHSNVSYQEYLQHFSLLQKR